MMVMLMLMMLKTMMMVMGEVKKDGDPEVDRRTQESSGLDVGVTFVEVDGKWFGSRWLEGFESLD